MIGQAPEVQQRNFPTRFFLPARISDSPRIRAEEYLGSLANLDAVRRRQLLEGDWDVAPCGNLFRREWFEFVDDWPREASSIVRAWDDATTRDGGDWNVGVLMAIASTGVTYVIDVVRSRGSQQGKPPGSGKVKGSDRTSRRAPNQAARSYPTAVGTRRRRQVVYRCPNARAAVGLPRWRWSARQGTSTRARYP